MESLASVVQPQVHPFVPVRQVQLAAVAVVGVCDVDEGLAEVCQLEQQSPLHLREFPALDRVDLLSAVVGEGEQPVRAAEILGDEGVDEGHVIVEAADLEDLLSSQAEVLVPGLPRGPVLAALVFGSEAAPIPAVLDVAVQLHADLVRVQPARPGARQQALRACTCPAGRPRPR